MEEKPTGKEPKWCPLSNLPCHEGTVRVMLGEEAGEYRCRFWGVRFRWDPTAEGQYRKTGEDCLLVFAAERP